MKRNSSWKVRLLAVFATTVGGLTLFPTAASAGDTQLIGGFSYNINWSLGQLTLNVMKLANPSTTYTTGQLRLDLVASAAPYTGGNLSGYLIARYAPGTLGPGAALLNTSNSVNLTQIPPSGTYYMTLVVTEAGCASPDGYCIDTWGSFPTPVVINTTSANNGLGNGLLQINTPYSYDVDFSKGTAKLVVEKVFNGSPSYTTGVLRLELWATSNPYSGGAISGHRIASYGFNAGGASGQLAPSGAYNKVNVSVPVETTPPLGTYYVTMVLSEFSSACPTADHYCLVDYGPFSSPLIMQPSDNGGGGGGGSTDALLLALLLLALAHRWLGAQRRRARVA